MDYTMRAEKIQDKHNNGKIAATHTRISSTKSQRIKIILKYLKLYCEHTSIVGVKYLAEPQKAWWERILWAVVNCIVIAGMLFVVSSLVHEFLMSPILISEDGTNNYRMTDLDFAGVAICSINRISRKAAMNMTTEIFNSKVTDLSFDEILILVSQLGNLYTSQFDIGEDRNDELHQLLRTYYKGDYDVTEIMKTLSPQCSSMMLKCKLYGKARNCSELFEFRKTQDGFCCTFNYARVIDDVPEITAPLLSSKTYKINDLGVHQGLTVLMEPLLEDYFHPIMPVSGWKVLVFNPFNYPDATTGAVYEVLVMPRSEMYIDVVPSVFYTTEAVSDYPIHKRKCRFPHEMEADDDDGVPYSFNHCILDCRAEEIQNICGCRPFFYPRHGKKEYSWRICNTADLGCLMRYKSKWINIFPHDSKEERIGIDQFWALHCRTCFPSCHDLLYDLKSDSTPISPGRYITDLVSNFTIVDHAILNVFFSEYDSLKLKQDVIYYWYDFISDIGGICGVFIGFSLISVMEFLFYVTLAIRDMFIKNKKSIAPDENREKNDKNAKAEDQPTYPIYWNELMPRPPSPIYYRPPEKMIRY